MPDGFVKRVLPYAQLGAVVVTVAVGGHKLIDIVLGDPWQEYALALESATCGEAVLNPDRILNYRDCGQPLEWAYDVYDDPVTISDGLLDGRAKVTTNFYKPRPDPQCPVSRWAPKLVDTFGFQYEVRTTVSRESSEQGLHQDVYWLDIPKEMEPGFATYDAQIIYDCPEGRKVVEYPQVKFCVQETPSYECKKT